VGFDHAPKELGSGAGVDERTVMSVQGDATTRGCSSQFLPSDAIGADAAPSVKVRFGAFALPSKKPRIESEVVAHEYRTIDSTSEPAKDFLERGGGRKHGGLDAVDVRSPDIPHGVQQGVKLIDGLERRTVEHDHRDLEHAVALSKPRCFTVDDGVLR
jgi:hypothetical protein